MLNKGIRLIGVLALLASVPELRRRFDSAAYKEGRKAENRKDWDTALVDYEKARAELTLPTPYISSMRKMLASMPACSTSGPVAKC